MDSADMLKCASRASTLSPFTSLNHLSLSRPAAAAVVHRPLPVNFDDCDDASAETMARVKRNRTTTTTITTKTNTTSTTVSSSSEQQQQQCEHDDNVITYYAAPKIVRTVPKRQQLKSLVTYEAERAAAEAAARQPPPPPPPPLTMPVDQLGPPGAWDPDASSSSSSADIEALKRADCRQDALLMPPSPPFVVPKAISFDKPRRAFGVLDGDDARPHTNSNNGDAGRGGFAFDIDAKRNYTLPPDFDELFAEFGEPKRPGRCWGCRIADAQSAALPMTEYNQLVHLICDGLMSRHPIAVADNVENFFRANILPLANVAAMDEKGRDLWNWRGIDIIWHFYDHSTEAGMDTFWQLYETKTLRKRQYMDATWKVRKSDGKKVPVKRGWKVLREMTLVEKSIRSSQPAKMFTHNPRGTITDKEARTMFGVKRITGAPVEMDEALVNM